MQRFAVFEKHFQKWKIFLLGILILITIISGCTTSGFSSAPKTGNPSIITITDSYGQTVNFSHPVERIVCQNGMIAELLIAIGEGNHIVGLADATMTNAYIVNQTPNAISIGDTMTPDVETLISLHPDLLIFYGYKKPTNLDKILDTNTTLIYTKGFEILELPSEARTLGKITGHETEAMRYARFTEHYFNLVNERLADTSIHHIPRVYMEAWTDYTVMASDSSANNLITLLHGRNIAENITVSGKVSPEWVIDEKPDVIFKLVTSGENASAAREKILQRPGYQSVPAIKNNQVYVLSSDTMSSPHAASGLLYMAKALYPDQFTDVDPEEVLHEYAREFLPGSDTPGSFYPSLSRVSQSPTICPAQETIVRVNSV